jgi:hypothetical protein
MHRIFGAAECGNVYVPRDRACLITETIPIGSARAITNKIGLIGTIGTPARGQIHLECVGRDDSDGLEA